MTTMVSHLGVERSSGIGDHQTVTKKGSFEDSHLEVYSADEETLIRLFTSKMKCALAEAGFDELAQITVAHLVKHNTVSCSISLRDTSSIASQLQPDSIQPQIGDLMVGEPRLNSNEPVLLILVDDHDRISSVDAKNIANASCTILRNIFDIFPVRVYVARHPRGQTRASAPHHGFSLAILNVVNTDIGGPSMIQLLDCDASSSDWDQMVVLSEAWSRTELLWGNDDKEVAKARSYASNRKDSIDDEYSTSFVNEHPNETSVAEDTVKPIIESAELCSAAADHHQEVTSEPFAELEDRTVVDAPSPEADRPSIQHPTWEHPRNNESLIDLIRRQVSDIDTLNISREDTAHGSL